MSSFLDSTGLSELASKLKAYFAKKDGSYPNMNVGNAYGINRAIISSGEYNIWWGIKLTHRFTRTAAISVRCLILRAYNGDNAGIVDLIIKERSDNTFDIIAQTVCGNTDNQYFGKVVYTLDNGVSYIGIRLSYYYSKVIPMIIGDTESEYSSENKSVFIEFGSFGSVANSLTRYDAIARRLTYTTDFEQVGSSSQPVYVSPSGEVTACTPADMVVGKVMNMEIGSSADDLNNHTQPTGGIKLLSISTANAANVTNRPVSGGGAVEIVSAAGGYVHQVFYPTDNSGDVFRRYRFNTIWSAWAKQAKTYCGWPNNTTGLHELGVFSSTGSNDNDITARFKISYTPMVLSQSVDIDLSINARCAISGTSITSTNSGPVVAYMKGTRTDVNCFTKLIDGKLHVYVGLLTDSHSLTCRCIWSVDSFQMSFSAVNNGVTTRPADLVPATRYEVQAQSF